MPDKRSGVQENWEGWEAQPMNASIRCVGENWHEAVFSFLTKSAYSWNPLTKELRIETPSGMVQVNPGDWIVKGDAGEFYIKTGGKDGKS